MEDLRIPDFKSVEEERNFWKDTVLQLKERIEELEDYQESSTQLEKEYEKSLEQSDKTIKDLRTKCNRLTLDVDTSREQTRKSNEQILVLQQEITEYRQNEEKLIQYIRKLEQENDDLERSQRAISESVRDYESKLNNAIERNALLETELDEKESLQTMVQRLKDEHRDMQQELSRQLRLNMPDNDKVRERVCSPTSIDSNKLSMETQTTNNITSSLSQPIKISPSVDGISTPSRVSAMNLVGDLLRKVGSLESKLAASRAGREQNNDSPAKESYRARHQRLNRATMSPTVNKTTV